MQVRSERGVELRHDRRHAAREIHPDHLVVRIGGRAVRQRQRRRVVDPNDGDGVRIVERVRVGHLHGIARQHAADVDVEARLAARGGTTVPFVVWSESDCDIWAASSSIWLCACGRTWSRIST